MLNLQIPDASLIEIILMIVAGVFGVLWWLVRRTVTEQADQISDLYEKHDRDAAKLQDLEVFLASNHYTKPELDVHLQKLELAIRESQKEVGANGLALAGSELTANGIVEVHWNSTVNGGAGAFVAACYKVLNGSSTTLPSAALTIA